MLIVNLYFVSILDIKAIKKLCVFPVILLFSPAGCVWRCSWSKLCRRYWNWWHLTNQWTLFRWL